MSFLFLKIFNDFFSHFDILRLFFLDYIFLCNGIFHICIFHSFFENLSCFSLPFFSQQVLLFLWKETITRPLRFLPLLTVIDSSQFWHLWNNLWSFDFVLFHICHWLSFSLFIGLFFIIHEAWCKWLTLAWGLSRARIWCYILLILLGFPGVMSLHLM